MECDVVFPNLDEDLERDFLLPNRDVCLNREGDRVLERRLDLRFCDGEFVRDFDLRFRDGELE